ncbi:MAG: glycosyltransferase family 4 protein, partial [Rhodospirillales bacterium]|nr:glycosyltransferase family 4 protein [Rhodospirillales bacterium]
MKVALVVEHLGIGGLPNYVLSLARLLETEGAAARVFHGNVDVPGHLDTDGLDIQHLPGLTSDADPSLARGAVTRLLTWQPDVVHVHLCGSLPTIDALLESGVPLVRTFHDLTSLCLRLGRRRWPGDRCQRALHWSCVGFGCMVSPPRNGSRFPHIADLSAKLGECSRYRKFGIAVACSSFMGRTLELNGFRPDRIRVVPNFSPFEAEARDTVSPQKRPGVPGRDRTFELLFAGQAVAGKGLEVLITALHGLEGEWRLTVLAEGPRLGRAKALADRFGLTDRIDFAGWTSQAQTRRHYRNADLFLLTSIIDEVLPMVGLEAMSFGTPLVGFAVGGIPDMLVNDETSVLVRDVSADGFRTALRQAMSDPSRLAFWGLQSRRLIAQRHTSVQHIAALQEAYCAARAVGSI